MVSSSLHSLHETHAVHGRMRHNGGRWQSRFNANEQGVGTYRRRLEQAERETGYPDFGLSMNNFYKTRATPSAKWAVRVPIVDAYNARALELIRGSGFVEAYHLLKAALELTLVGVGMGATPHRRGNLLTALTLNNIGCYHRRRGQGKQALQHLLRAQEIEGADVSVSTQLNLCVVLGDLGARARALEHIRKAVQRMEEQAAAGLAPPTERAAVVGVALHNLGVDLRDLAREQTGERPEVRRAGQTVLLGTEYHPDLESVVTSDGAATGQLHSSFRPDFEARWCHE